MTDHEQKITDLKKIQKDFHEKLEVLRTAKKSLLQNFKERLRQTKIQEVSKSLNDISNK